jgi:nicotinamidase-related amidase
MRSEKATRENAALLLVDIQEKLFPLVDHPCEILDKTLTLIKGCQILKLPILVSEQYPKGLGHTIAAIKEAVGEVSCIPKTAFSCLGEPALQKAVEEAKRSHWILAGIEAHVCILQTARSLLDLDKKVIVINDAISSRSIYDFSTAIAELRDMGARVTSCETLLFDLTEDASAPEFKQLVQLIKQ